jgi:hypothetical protein
MGRCWAAHPLTHLLTALGVESRWRGRAHVAAYGAWDRDAVERQTRRVIAPAWPARGGGDHPVAWADPQWHRTRAQVWGPGTVPASSARRPKRAETVRAHHGGVRGDVVPGTPWP